MILLRKTTIGSYPALLPTDSPSEDALLKMKDGATVAVTAKLARYPKQHRLYFAVAYTVYDNLPENDGFDSFDEFRKASLIAIGHTRPFKRMDGRVEFEAESISFHECKQALFKRVFDKSIDLWCARWGHDRETLINEAG